MKKYRKKPVIIEALIWTGGNHRDMFDFLTSTNGQYMDVSGENFIIDHTKSPSGLIIRTLEGDHVANAGDYIIKGVKGEFYPCKPDIFAMTYEEIINDIHRI